MEDKKIKKMLLEIPEEIHTEFKATAAKLKITMTQLIQEMMLEKIKAQNNP